jgi:hypothetical protein
MDIAHVSCTFDVEVASAGLLEKARVDDQGGDGE